MNKLLLIVLLLIGCSKNPNLMPCPDCGREVSRHAAICPACGYGFAEIKDEMRRDAARRAEAERRRNIRAAEDEQNAKARNDPTGKTPFIVPSPGY